MAWEGQDLKVLVLCGGKGERLKPYTENVPKPLIRIKDRPILSYLLSHFESYGFHKFVIAVGYKAETVIEYFEREHRDIQVEFVDSGDANIIDRIKDSSKYISGDFIMSYGDTLADVDLDGLIRFHQRHDGDVSLTCYPLQSQFGVLEIADTGKVTSFVEKPVLDKWINIGYYYFSERIMSQVNKHQTFLDFLHQITSEGNLYSYRHKGTHITVNTVKELQEAETNITRVVERIEKKKNE
jgi:glucose-1-phosphate cytidylyltransferase